MVGTVQVLGGDALLKQNNLSDLANAATALTNLGLGTTATTVTVGLSAGANNELVVTVTVKDSAGATVAAPHALELWLSDAATGIGLTGTSVSGSLVASTGVLHTTLTAKKHFTIMTAATGIFAGTITDTSETATLYVAVKRPIGAGVIVSAVSGTTWG